MCHSRTSVEQGGEDAVEEADAAVGYAVDFVVVGGDDDGRAFGRASA